MRIRSLFDATLGRLRFPLRALGVGVQPGEAVLDTRFPRVRTNEITPRDARFILDIDLNTPGNPPALGPDGVLPSSVIPPTSGGGSSDSLIGEIRMWAGFPLRTPAGWLVCDGSELLISTNPDLFNVIGHLYGRASDPVTKFKLPNFIGRGPVGAVGVNDASSGQVWKVNVRNRGIGFTPGTYVGLPLVADGSTIISTPVTVTIVVNADGGVDEVRVVDGGQVSNLASSAAPTTDPSNCTLRIPAFGGAGFGFTYDILLAPTSSAAQAWGVRVTRRGEGYSGTPEVTISGGGLVGATARAVMDGANVREVIVTNPGVGDPTGATVSFAGGGPSVAATAAIQFFTSPVVPGDVGGEQQHFQTRYEVGEHYHVQNNGAFGGGNSGIESSGTGDTAYRKSTFVRNNTQRITGDSSSGNSLETIPVQSMPIQAPYVGLLFLIRAS